MRMLTFGACLACAACGGRTTEDAGLDASYDGPFSCVDEPSPNEQERVCTQTNNKNLAIALCGEADAAVIETTCPPGYSGCCVLADSTNCYYPPTYIPAVAAECAAVDGSFASF